ncbi:MAG: dipeptidase [Armatimonadota bacterium]
MTWLIDGHEDLAFNAVVLGRDLTRPVAEIRRAEGETPAHGEGVATVSLPALRAADVRVVLATLFTAPARALDAHGLPGYRTPEDAYRQSMDQLDYYHRLHVEGEATLIRTRQALEAVVAGTAPRPGLVVLMEGADPLRTPDDLAAFVQRGVRFVGPAWHATRYAGGTGEPGPLTELGYALLREMARLGVMLDLSHLADEACAQALEAFPGRVVATHANSRFIVPNERQLPDDVVRAVAERDGVIGLVCYNRFVRAGWTEAQGKAAVSLDDLLPHARRIAGLAGARHLALGSDLDGGIGREHVPRELDTAADLPILAQVLAAGGFTPDEVEGILHGNWLRLLREILPEA